MFKKQIIYFYLASLIFINSCYNICLAQSLYQTLSKVYLNSPLLKSNQLKLEAINEELAKAISNNRPKLSIYGNIGSDKTKTVNTSGVESTKNNNPKSLGIELTQNLYDFGRAKSLINIADATIFAQRAELRHQEQEILLETSKIYFRLLAFIEINKLAKNNLILLQKHYQATSDKFEIGEATSTDLSLAKARYLRAKSDEIKSVGDIEKEKSKYFSLVGIDAPKNLFFPENRIKLPTKLKEITREVLKENPKIIASGFRKKLSFIKISSAATKLLPSLDLNLSAQNAWAPNTFFDEYENYKMELNLNFPLYSGGYNYSNVRQKKKEAMQESKILDYNIKGVLKETEMLWIDLNSLESQIVSIEATIVANEMAVDGVKKEYEVGLRTLLDVLDSEQGLLEEKVEVIKAKRDKFITVFSLIANTGKLSPKQLKLNVDFYDYEKNYSAVKNLWLGFDDK
jgi:outer membrane protein